MLFCILWNYYLILYLLFITFQGRSHILQFECQFLPVNIISSLYPNMWEINEAFEATSFKLKVYYYLRETAVPWRIFQFNILATWIRFSIKFKKLIQRTFIHKPFSNVLILDQIPGRIIRSDIPQPLLQVYMDCSIFHGHAIIQKSI